MPYVIDTDGILEVTMIGSHEFQQVMTVLHYKVDAPAQIADGAAALNSFWTIFGSGAEGPFEKWRSCLSVKCTNIHTQLQWVHQSRFAFIDKIKGDATEGTVVGNAMPVNSAVAITKRTQNAGRDQVGTTHMPAVPASFIENGLVTGGAVVIYAAFADAIKTIVTTSSPVATYRPVLYRRDTPEVSPVIVNTSVRPTARVMRRRTVGVGA